MPRNKYVSLVDAEIGWGGYNSYKAFSEAEKYTLEERPNFNIIPATVPVKPRGGKFKKRIGYAKLSNYNTVP